MLEIVLTILWTHTNNIVFKTNNCNPSYVLELVKENFVRHCTIDVLIVTYSEVAGSNLLDASKSNNLKKLDVTDWMQVEVIN